ncbi:collagenase [Shewanella sp. ULN5]|uniref:collagenase n=1 Tax=Shewanella sp. ULN5 TaxID=2994678 RepID=UPI00273E3BF1|nr:collagenase [Shewanella sp. ULN5]MDP5147447.1 collagenase [Shewanella sp. ULN5]
MLTRSFIALSFLYSSLVLLSGCSTVKPIDTNPAIAQQLQTTSVDQFFTHDYQHTRDSFNQAVKLIQNENIPEQLDRQLYFLRAFSYFGPLDTVTQDDKQRLTNALIKLSTLQAFNDSPRLQEHFAVTLYLYYNTDDTALLLSELLPILNTQLTRLAKQPITEANDYALWETLRAYGLLLTDARKNNEGALSKQLIDANISQALLAFASSPESLRAQQDWPRANAYWALGQYRLALPSGEDGNPTSAELAIDSAVAKIAKADVDLRGSIAKHTYTLGFHVNAFAGQESCQQLNEICQIPTLSEILPINYPCSDSLFILAQDLNQQELALSCEKLTSQESSFHQLLQTQNTPTANDGNNALRVVAFKNWSQYNAYGQLLFDIQTDNGGMYIEGTPSKPGNQATFFAYRQFWIEPEFAIWNLNHEYVHYLDGHFVKYGGFGHFPSKMVWWSEGLAEYVSKGNDNPTTFEVIKRDIEKAPTLAEIFATEYKDGQDRTYKWSYMAIRFLAENYHDDFVQLSRYLKTDYFEGYELLLVELSKHQQQFAVWLNDQAAAFENETAQAPAKINKLDRYGYRDYLIPSHLTQNNKHLHF